MWVSHRTAARPVTTSRGAWLTSARLTRTAISPLSSVACFPFSHGQINNTRHKSSTTKTRPVNMSRKRKASPDLTNEQHQAPPLLDPWGRDLTPQTLTAAGNWWKVRRQIDQISDEDLGSEGSARLLMEAAHLRREYTRLAAGWRRRGHVLQPNSRTYEPPLPEFVGSLPPHPPIAPALAPVVDKVARAYQQLQQTLDRFSCNHGANWPILDLVKIEYQRREYHYQLDPPLLEQHGFCWEPRVPDVNVLQQSTAQQSLQENSASRSVINPAAPEDERGSGQPEPDSTAVGTEESQHPTPELDDRPPLCPEQERVVRLAEQGENIFYTGSAGCGKSTVLHEIRRRLREQGKVVKVVAPTGIVALAINGSTTWTFMGWSPAHNKMALGELCERTNRDERVRKTLRRVDTLIIDEISMVENNFFERMDKVLRHVRRLEDRERRPGVKDRAAEPFGGIQLIVTGDFCQLPPVKPFTYCGTCGFELRNNTICPNSDPKSCPVPKRVIRMEDRFAFSSEAWRRCDFKYVHLKTIHRQQDEDFRALLEKCRTGIPFNDADVDVLMKHESHTEGAVQLLPTREEVQARNREAFAQLPDPAFLYKCSDGRHIEKHHPYLETKYAFATSPHDPNHKVIDLFNKDHRFEEVLQLKKGMSVLLLVNLSLREGLCNGSQGTIVGFESLDIGSLKASLEEKAGLGTTQREAIERFTRDNFNSWERLKIALPVVRFQNGVERTILPECQANELGDPAPYSLVWRTQIPLTAGYALTIHKAQGMTLERVIVNLDKAFEDGQVYVALSRAKSLKGLKIEGNPHALKAALEGDPVVRSFMEEATWIEFDDVE